MAERIELHEEDLEKVVGGAFIYTTREDGSLQCRVEAYGTYPGGVFSCSESAKRKISLYIMNNNPQTLEEIVNYALGEGLFW